MLVVLSTSWASGRVRVVVGPGVPFSSAELASAMVLRTSEPPVVRVTTTATPGQLLVVVGRATRRVDVQTLRGAAAARRVVLVTLDLILGRGQAPVASVEIAARRPAPGPSVARVPTISRVPTTRHNTSMLLSSAGLLTSQGAGGLIDLSVALSERLRVVASAGLITFAGKDNLRLSRAYLGLGIERPWDVAFGVVSAQMRLLASPHRIAVDDGADRLSDEGVRLGSSLVLTTYVPVTSTVSLVLAGHAEGYLTRTRYLVGGAEVLVTDRVAAALTAGVSIRLGGGR